MQSWPHVSKVHLISATCEHDFAKNGLNEAPIDMITVWIAERDQAMNWAGTISGKWLGYDTLGRDGAKNATVPIKYIREPFGHVEWFTDKNFQTTMERITSDETHK
jgi:hypothetical protein